MNENIVQEILHELFSSLEALETKSTAILQLLKEKGLATEQELALHLEQAGNASNVRWRGVRVRIDHLVSSAVKIAEQESSKREEDSRQSPTQTEDQTSRASEGEKEGRNAQQVAPSRQSQGNDVDTTPKKNQSQPATENEDHGPGENAKKNAA